MGKCIVHFLPAKAGDCILIELDYPSCILIDSGFRDTYEQHLKPLLLQLSSKGYHISLLIVTHIDRDHIEGAISFLAENGPASNPKIIPVDNIWINGFFNTLFRRPEFNSRRSSLLTAKQHTNQKTIFRDLCMRIRDDGLISARQSKAFEELCARGGYRVNQPFVDGVVKCTATNRQDALTAGIVIGGCKITVLGPREEQLAQLAKKLNREMIVWFGADYKIQENGEFAKFFEEVMKFYEEPFYPEQISATGTNLKNWLNTSTFSPMNDVNRASIVVEIEYQDRNMLFMADGESEDWEDLLAPTYQLIKLSHHGTSKPNLALFNKSQGECMLISTNGRTNGQHPEDDLLARAILCGTRDLYFNYDISRKQHLIEMQNQYKFTAHFGEKTIML